MSLAEIANNAAQQAANKKNEDPLVQKLLACFEEPGFVAIKDHLEKSGFRATSWHEAFSIPQNDVTNLSYATAAMQFEKNELNFIIRAGINSGNADADPEFYFQRSDRPKMLIR